MKIKCFAIGVSIGAFFTIIIFLILSLNKMQGKSSSEYHLDIMSKDSVKVYSPSTGNIYHIELEGELEEVVNQDSL